MSSHDVSLDERHVRAARLEAEGTSTVRIADAVGVDRRTIYRWREKPEYVALVTSLTEEAQRVARAILQAGATDAATRVRDLIHSEDERIALSAAQTLLDRTGHPKAERVEIGGKVEASGSVALDASDRLAALLSGGS